MYTQCPGCSHTNISPVLDAQDHTVSHETFSIWECGNCTLRFTQNVPEPAAIGRYYQSDAYVSHSDTKKGLINRLYHIVRNITLQQKHKMITAVSGKKTGSLLDVGAGTGAFAAVMQQNGWKVTGLEPDETARANAQQNHGLTLQTLESLHTLPAASYDVITMWHVLEHVHDLHGYLNRYQSVLQQSGTLVIAVPNYTSFDAQHYGASWAAYDVPRHLYHFSPASMRSLLAQHGFEVVALKPMKFDSFYVSMLSEQYLTGKSNLFAAFINGWKSNKKAASSPEKSSSVIYIAKKR
ncbi:Methyltransferase domain-containing protein [Filimonas lacunae]|uniref:Methyltransferase domain-containing protein n=1 Tax=Filimonas lacunae TaxID=477680 RepID=A0A173MAR0_9BACT|nr:class I SAM-dependent methyltransferase [Filimonas lacunae]BAV04617.1 SAM-dependent methyltransferases [Filimonas lacunae]SIT32636.1 Methyltransferase domain-containing protein [Filimonas lacunae]